MTGYDIIGDVHGFAGALVALLTELGYTETKGAFRHPERQAILVGDLIDRGPEQIRTLEIARAMIEAGTAQVLMGNHEFNAVAWATRNHTGEWSRPHTDKNRDQHAAFLDAVGENSARHYEWIDWMRTLPMWLDLGGLRVVHACWHQPSMDLLGSHELTDRIVTADDRSPVGIALEVVLKGPEINLGGVSYTDNSGICRDKARYRWWDPDANTIASGCEIPSGATACDGGPLPALPDTALDLDVVPTASLEVPVLYGHYWRSGAEPRIDNPSAACLDWSVVNGGPLVAYRWSGEPELSDDNLVGVSSP